MAKVDGALPGAMILQVHDELVLEVLEAEAAAAAVLTGCMTDAYAEVFPESPIAGLVSAAIIQAWSAAKSP